MSSETTGYTLAPTLRPNNKPAFPIGWLILVIILIILLTVVLFFFFRQRTQLIEPSSCPKIKSRYAVRPGVTKTVLQACGASGQEICQFPSDSLSTAIQHCELNHKICTEFSYDPITQVVRIVDPHGQLSSTQQENLYLLQVGVISV